jgi:hypothetical protein
LLYSNHRNYLDWMRIEEWYYLIHHHRCQPKTLSSRARGSLLLVGVSLMIFFHLSLFSRFSNNSAKWKTYLASHLLWFSHEKSLRNVYIQI